jgi:hypothetical protein
MLSACTESLLAQQLVPLSLHDCCLFLLKAVDLKKLQAPLYEFYNTVNAQSSQGQGADQSTDGRSVTRM